MSIEQNVSGDLLDGAERSRATLPMTSATGPAASTTTSNVQLELQGARLRSSHALWGWVEVGRVWDGLPRDRAAQMGA